MTEQGLGEVAPVANRWRPTRSNAARIALGYLLFSSLWISFSGAVLHYFIQDPAKVALGEDIKGWGFVAVTALLLFWVLNQCFHDIRVSSQKLQDEERRLRVIGDNLPESYVFQYVSLAQGPSHFTYVSAGVERVNGLAPAAVIRDAACLFDQIGPDSRPAHRDAEAQSAANLTDLDLVLKIRAANQTEKLVQIHSRPRRRPDGTVEWDGFVTDVTARKRDEASRLQAEQALQRSEQNYREIFNATNEAIFLHDAVTGAVLDVNDAMLRMFGYASKDEIWADPAGSTFWGYPPYTFTEARRRIRLAVEQGSQVFEWLARTKSGEALWVEVSLRNSHIGGVGRVLAVVRDISERKRQELELQRLNRSLDQRVHERTAELRASNEELDAFVYAVSHDLRAPLRAMSGFSEALVEDFSAQLPPTAREYLNHIQAGSRAMGELIDGLLRLSRCTKGDLQHDRVDLSGMATRILEHFKKTAPQRDIVVSIQPGLTVPGDARLLELALVNLLGNAFKYSAGKPQAVIKVSGQMDSIGATISVADNGAGFDMRHAGKLFQPFQRLHREDEFPGLGIGLATVQRIIRRHGGTIQATAAPGAGATFTFTLPAPSKT